MKNKAKLHAANIESAAPFRRRTGLLCLLLLLVVPQLHSLLQHRAPTFKARSLSRSTPSALLGRNLQLPDENDSLCTLCSVLESAVQPAGYSLTRPPEPMSKLSLAGGQLSNPERRLFDHFIRPPPRKPLDPSLAG